MNSVLLQSSETETIFFYHHTIEQEAEKLELVSKELNHLAAILYVYAGSLIFIK